ncbi:MAG: N-acetylglucosamine-6-phosphate deacetylase [Lachnospiraceae bacterium]|nr:N-acetylglucosamine-6-phosphate deacetylase [Lachnospiraceae bacterium]
MNYKLTGGRVYDPDYKFRQHDVYIRDGKFANKEDTGNEYETMDMSGMTLIPGLTDIHFHGCKGHDFCEGDKDVIQLMADYEESRGITTICPATMTFPEEKLNKIMAAVREYPNEKGAYIAGVNMEGPFISQEKKGAQNPEYITEPDIEMFKRLQEVSGNKIKLVALAPETKGAEEFIAALKDKVIISFAHSAADYEGAKKAFEIGVHHVTHLFNGMAGIDHRTPGPVFAAFESEGVEAEMICDGVHIHPSVVRAAIKLLGEDRVIFISDSMEAVGMPEGEYELGGQPVIKRGNEARLKDGTIAGSASDLMDVLRTAVLKMGIPLESAVRFAAVNPAKSIGIYDRTGSIEEGKAANLAVLGENIELKYVFSRGKLV